MAQRENGIKNYLIVRIRLRTSCLLVGVIVNRRRSMTPKKEGIVVDAKHARIDDRLAVKARPK